MVDTFLAGGAAAAMSICFVNPMDVVKSRLQLQGELGAKASHVTRGVAGELMHIGKTEGLRGLYRGLGPAVLYQFSGNSIRFGVYHVGKQMAGVPEGAKLDSGTNFMFACLSGTLAGFLACPFFLLKTQFQVQGGGAGFQHSHTTMTGAASAIYKEGGVSAFWAGADAFVPRVIALVSVQMTAYDYIKQKATENGIDGMKNHFLSSALAAGAACIAMQPFDLVAARLMNQPKGTSRMYAGPIDCAIKTVKAEGPIGLYKGCLANYLRMSPQYILTFIFFEQIKLFLDKEEKKQ
jgi:solute carrier family 25 protein 34/35